MSGPLCGLRVLPETEDGWLSRDDSVGKEARPHPNPLPQEREPDDAAREQSLSGGPCPTLAKLHPLLGERAGVRENFQSQLNRSGLVLMGINTMTFVGLILAWG